MELLPICPRQLTFRREQRFECLPYFPFFPSLKRRLGRGQPGDRHAEGRAAHVVEADLVAELDRRRVAAVFAADAALQVLRACCGPCCTAISHELADAADVERLERVALEDFLLQVVGQEACSRRRG